MKNIIKISALVIACLIMLTACELPFFTSCKHDDPEKIVAVEGREPTCTEKGLTSGKRCTLCGEMTESQAEIPTLEHDFSEWITIEESTISQKGLKQRICQICSYAEQRELALQKTKVTLFLYEDEDIIELTRNQINEFLEIHPEYDNFYFDIIGFDEIGGFDYGMTPHHFEIEYSPDLYFSDLWYAVDRFLAIDALSDISNEYLKCLEECVSPEMLDRISLNGSVYGYPLMTTPNLCTYYDKSIITNPESLEQMIADVEAYNETHPDSPKYICFDHREYSYSTSFLFAVDENGERLCHIDFDTDSNGNFTAHRDNINSENGIIAMKGMEKLLKSSCHSDDTIMFEDAAVIITDKMLTKELGSFMGDNLTITDLPSFTVNGKTYHMGSMSKMKFMGIKPQEDSYRQKFLLELAQYLMSTECQMDRYKIFGWIPTNLDAQNRDEYINDVFLCANTLQNKTSLIHGAIHGTWWDVVKVISWDIPNSKSEEEMYRSLEIYDEVMKSLFMPTCGGDWQGWSVIGEVSGSKWDKDFHMEKVSENIWESEPVVLEIGSLFKLRYSQSWNVQIGADGKFRTEDYEPHSIVSEVAGTYIIRMEWDGISDTAKITFIPAE